MSVLCKVDGCLLLMSTITPPEGRTGRCPLCHGTEFRDAPYGWVECTTGECDFAVLKSHLDRLADDVANLIGAYI